MTYELPCVLRTLAHDTVVTENAPHLPVRVRSDGGRVTPAIRTRRATCVPFTAVSTSPERTTTDNTEVAATCAVAILAGNSSARSGGTQAGSRQPRSSSGIGAG
jgi:hypothetical protein